MTDEHVPADYGSDTSNVEPQAITCSGGITLPMPAAAQQQEEEGE
jgi:hypothetical protein